MTRAYKALHLSRSGEVAVPFEHPVPGPGYVEIAEIGRAVRFEIQSRKGRVLFDPSPRVALLDFDELEFPLILRSFRPGDRFQPLGMEGEKKIKDLFINLKVPALQARFEFIDVLSRPSSENEFPSSAGESASCGWLEFTWITGPG